MEVAKTGNMEKVKPDSIRAGWRQSGGPKWRLGGAIHAAEVGLSQQKKGVARFLPRCLDVSIRPITRN